MLRAAARSRSAASPPRTRRRRARARCCRPPPTPRPRAPDGAAAARRFRRGLHPVRDRGDRRAGHRRVRVDAAEGVEMTLRRPHRLEAVGVREPGAVEQQPVLVVATRFRACEVEQAERRVPARLLRARQCAALAVQYHRGAARQRPEELEHRDVERQARHRQPRAGRDAQPLVHRGEEVEHVAVLDHHALGASRRARRVDHVGEVFRPGDRRRHRVRLRPQLRRDSLERKDLAVGFPGGVSPRLLRDHEARLRVLEHERQPLWRIVGIERHVGPASAHHREQRHHQLDLPVEQHRYPVVRPDAARTEQVRQAAHPLVQFPICQAAPPANERHVLRVEQRPLMHEAVDRPARVHRCRGGIPVAHHPALLVVRQQWLPAKRKVARLTEPAHQPRQPLAQ